MPNERGVGSDQAPLISKVSIRNYKCLRELEFAPERLSVFVGMNASGKTSILQSIDFLCNEVRRQNSRQPFTPGGRSALDSVLERTQSRQALGPVVFEIETGEVAVRYLLPPNADGNKATKAGNGWDGIGLGIRPAKEPKGWMKWTAQNHSQFPVPRSILLQLETTKLVTPGFAMAERGGQLAGFGQANGVHGESSEMAPNGSGMHQALSNMNLSDPDSWNRLQDDLRTVIPSIRRLRFQKVLKPNEPTSLIFDTVGATSLSADDVSEGTLLVLGLLAAIHSVDSPAVVLLDDIDRGLHPRAQKDLLALLRKLLETKPNVQILATTHSPYLVDCLEPREVFMTRLDDNGDTVCQPLTKHPEVQQWKDEFHSGEMWSMFGEGWVGAVGAGK